MGEAESSLIRLLEYEVRKKGVQLEADFEEKIKCLRETRGKELIEEWMVILDMEDKKQIRSLEKRRLKKFG